MATKNNKADAPTDFDDLLGLTSDDGNTTASDDNDIEDLLDEMTPSGESTTTEDTSVAPQAASTTEPIVADPETPEQARIRALRAELAKPVPVFSDEPDTPEQAEIKDLEDQLARRQSAVVEKSPTQYAPTATGETILIHVLLDGFIAMGEVWYRGQELEFAVGSEAYEQTKDRRGVSWVDLASDLPAQYARWGKQYLGEGRFIGRPDEKFEDDIAKADQRRGRAVPLVRN